LRHQREAEFDAVMGIDGFLTMDRWECRSL
jgi:hypothetical protein